MIYILAIFVPPLALVAERPAVRGDLQPGHDRALHHPRDSFFPLLWAVPSAHGVIAISMRRDARKHREIVDAIEKHGPPPEWRR